MRRYRNKKTGTVIEVESEILSGNWEKVDKTEQKQSTAKASEQVEKTDLSYKELQQKATGYGIKCVGKSAETLKTLIKEHEEVLENATSQDEVEEPKSAGTIIKARKDR